LSPHGSMLFQFDGFFFQESAIPFTPAAADTENLSNKSEQMSIT
jgi:hypothetical protein